MADKPPAVGFNNATRQSIFPLPPFAYSANAIIPIQLPQVGFLSKILIGVKANVTAGAHGTYTTNTTAPIPDPFRFIKRVRLATNEGAELVNMSGYGLYLFSRILRTQFDVRNPSPSLASTNTAYDIYNAPATIAQGATADVNFMIEIPVAWGEQLQAGLLLLQNPVTRIMLELTFGDATTDLITLAASGGAAALTVNTISVNSVMEIYNVPDDRRNYPNINEVQLLREELVPIVNVGDFQYRPALGNTYLDHIMQFENNGARMLPANFSQFGVTYAQTQNAYRVQPQFMEYRTRRLLGNQDLPDGVYWWPWDCGFGIPEINTTRDVFDTSRITDMQLTTGIAPTVTLTNAQVRVISRQLAMLG